MRNFSFIYLITLALCVFSCIDKDLPNVNGMWQLKTIQDKEGNIEKVDTIYYSFQRQVLFSYTWLNGVSASSLPVLYGYVDFSDDNTLNVTMDAMYEESVFNGYPRLEKNMSFNIVKLNSKEMILSTNEEVHKFIKF